jgi:hypothetical protein
MIFQYKDNFEPQVSFGQGKLLAQSTLHSFLSLPWLGIESYGSKIYLYRNIFFIFFIEILFAKISRVNKALELFF